MWIEEKWQSAGAGLLVCTCGYTDIVFPTLGLNLEVRWWVLFGGLPDENVLAILAILATSGKFTDTSVMGCC